jgi:hypothetical protein
MEQIKVDKKEEKKAFKELLEILFESACHSCSYVPEEYHQDIYKGTLNYAFEKLSNGMKEKKVIIVEVYEKWTGIRYDSYESDSE